MGGYTALSTELTLSLINGILPIHNAFYCCTVKLGNREHTEKKII